MPAHSNDNASMPQCGIAFIPALRQYPLTMNSQQLAAQLQPILADVRERATVAERFIDKDVYQISLATLWANVVLNPEELGFSEVDLEPTYELLSADVAALLGSGSDLKTCFAYLNSKAGEQAMLKARLNQTHKEMLLYFASMMLDPDGHRRWTDEIRNRTR